MVSDYGSERNFFENRVTRQPHRQINEEIFDFFYALPRESQILDVGCGDGFFLFFLREFGFKDIRGIDLFPSFVERCRKRGLNVELVDAMFYEPGFKFDLIAIIEVLEHAKDAEALLKRIRGFLKENGQILITVPVLDSLSSRWSRLKGKVTRLEQCQAIDETHVHAFSKSAIFNIIKKAGFGIKTWQYCYNPLPYRFRKVLSRKTCSIFERITLFNTCGENLFIVGYKTKP